MIKSIIESLITIKMYRENIQISTLAQFEQRKTIMTHDIEQNFDDQFLDTLLFGIHDDSPQWFGIEGTDETRTYHLELKILLLYILNTPDKAISTFQVFGIKKKLFEIKDQTGLNFNLPRNYGLNDFN